MRSTENIEKLVQNLDLDIETNHQTDHVILNELLDTQKKTIKQTPAFISPNLGRLIMKSPITKIAAAVIIITALTLSIHLWNKLTPIAYAFEQTIEANNSIRYLHIRNFTNGKDEPREGWLVFDQNGNVINVRAHMPEWASPIDGPRVMVWKDNTIQMWLKKKNTLGIMTDTSAGEQLANIRQNFDPKMIVNHIYELRSQGQVNIEIDEPSETSEPIIMTVTYLPESSTPNQRKVLSIDPISKLVNTIELYRLYNGQYENEGLIELLDYNQSIHDKMFDLQNEVPSETMILDQTLYEPGLAQGQLDDEQAAVEVVRQFFGALISGDYSKAGRLFVFSMPANQLQQQFSNVKILRVVSIGPAVPNTKLETKGFNVPCTIEIEKNGQQTTTTLEGIKVRQLHNQPDHWGIFSMGD